MKDYKEDEEDIKERKRSRTRKKINKRRRL